MHAAFCNREFLGLLSPQLVRSWAEDTAATDPAVEIMKTRQSIKPLTQDGNGRLLQCRLLLLFLLLAADGKCGTTKSNRCNGEFAAINHWASPLFQSSSKHSRSMMRDLLTQQVFGDEDRNVARM